jgi:hypothetical protein
MGSFFKAVFAVIVKAVKSKAFREVVVPVVTEKIREKIEKKDK